MTTEASIAYHERIYLEGGPPWKSDYNGRGDFGLIKPVDRVLMYPDDGGPCEYVRTNRTWKSPVGGDLHTVFQFTARHP